MRYLVRVKSRMLLKKNNYISTIEDEKVTMIFEKQDIAKATWDAMKKADEDCDYDGKNTIILYKKGHSALVLKNATIKELDKLKKSTGLHFRLNYTIENL